MNNWLHKALGLLVFIYGLSFDSLDLHKWIKRKQITQLWILVLNNTDMECFGCDKSVCFTRVAGHYGKVWVVHLLSEASTWWARTSSVRSHPSPSQWISSLSVLSVSVSMAFWDFPSFFAFFFPLLFVVLRNGVIWRGTKKLCDMKNCWSMFQSSFK